MAAVAADWLQARHATNGSAAAANGTAAAQRRRLPPFYAMVGFWGGHFPYLDEVDPPALNASWSEWGPGDDYANVALGDVRMTSPEGARGSWTVPMKQMKEAHFGRIVQLRRGLRVRERRWDASVGLILRALTDLELWPTTALVLHGDHGLSVGEYGTVGKGKLLDVDCRVPMLLRFPAAWGADGVAQRQVGWPVELLDVCLLYTSPSPRDS